jgi:hypothetical protein
MDKACYKGWSEELGNKSGQCCCNCLHQRPIVGHPGNKRELTKRPFSAIIGYGCTMPEIERIVFFDGEHGMCEGWTDRDNVVKMRLEK